MISTVLIPRLKERFSERALQVSRDVPPIVKFLAVDSEVGDLELRDDGDEITVFLGRVAHVHIGYYDDDLPQTVREEMIAKDVVDFLDRVFSEQIEFYGTRWSGGCGPRGSGKGEVYVWSGRVSASTE